MALGEMLLLAALTLLLLGEFVYWYGFHGRAASSIGDWKEQLARTFGQLGNAVMGLLVLPLTRNSSLSFVLGVSWEKSLAAHRLLCWLLLAIVLVHQLSFWGVYVDNNCWPADIAPFPASEYDPSNWSIPLIVIVSWTVVLGAGILALARLIFRTPGVFILFRSAGAGAFFVAALWHATSAWQYALSGLALWVIDRLLRLRSTGRGVRIQALESNSEADADVVTLSYLVEGYGGCCNAMCGSGALCACCECKCCAGGRHNDGSQYGPLNHESGQFVLINIPALSEWEWHPFSISSSPGDEVTTHHIKARGPLSWSGQLLSLAKQAELVGSFKANELVMHVEGELRFPSTASPVAATTQAISHPHPTSI